MITFDHLRIRVTDLARSRDWYIRTPGLNVEFEVPDRKTVAFQDTGGFTIVLQEVSSSVAPNQCALWSTRGVQFVHGPRTSYWGYGAELADPDGYVIRLWDEQSMQTTSPG